MSDDGNWSAGDPHADLMGEALVRASDKQDNERKERLLIPNDEERNALSDFNEVDNRESRDYNRGAILANIHETYLTDGLIKGNAVKRWLMEVNAYLNRIPKDEWESAKEAMRLHLTKRGYA